MIDNEQKDQNPASNKTFQEIYAAIVAKAWFDPAFKERFLAAPADVLKEHGVSLPEGKRVVVLEDNSDTLHLTLPVKPDQGEDRAAHPSVCQACEPGC